MLNLRDREPASIRAGLIPCGGVIRPVATERALLVGDAALKHGLAAGHAITDFLAGKPKDRARWFVDS